MQHQINQLLVKAFQSFQAGDLGETEIILSKVLRVQSKNFDALHIMGVINGIKNKHGEALEFFKRALKIDPSNGLLNFNIAKAFSEIGDHDKSLKFHQYAVNLNPNYQEAWLNYGKSLSHLNRPKEALDSYNKAIGLKPDYAEAWTNRGNALIQLLSYEDALRSFERALEINPGLVEAWLSHGNVLDNLERYDQSLSSYDKAISINSEYAEAWSNRGNVLQKLGKYDQALASYDKAISIKSGYAEAWSNRGNALQKLERYDEALVSCDKAISFQSNYAEAWSNRGNALQKLEKYNLALASYEKAISIKSDYAEAWSNRASAFQELKQYHQALSSCDKAISIKSDFAEAWSNHGNALQELKQYDLALASYDKAISIKSDYAEAWSNRGNTLQELKQYDLALASYDKAISIKSDYAEAWSNRGNALGSICKFELAEASYREAIRIDADCLIARSNLLFNMNYLESLIIQDVLVEARDYGVRVSQKSTPKFSAWNCSSFFEKIRVGFVSGDLSNHPVGYFIEGLMEFIDKDKFEIYAFSTKASMDDLTDRIKPFFEEWMPIYGMSDSDAAEIIYQKEIQVLIDLSGHTAHNRLPVFSYKPAPVQVSWLGYFATTGLPEMDYFLGDPHMLPAGEEGHFMESVWRLPETWFCSKPPNFQLEVSELPALRNGFLTFGALGNLSKMNDQVIMAWASVLHKIPGSKMLLKSKQLGDAMQIQAVQERFGELGISVDRLIFEGPDSRQDYFATYNKVDFVLDTFPYPGGTTSVDALWMGVPVLTIKGSRFLSHLGESIAINAGNMDWVAQDIDDYINKATLFASDLERLSQLRNSLRERVLRSPLFDSERFAKNFGDALWGMWGQRKAKYGD